MTTGTPLRHDFARRHAGTGHVAVRAGEGPSRPQARRARSAADRGGLPRLQPQGAGAVRDAGRGRAAAGLGLRVRDDPAPRRRRRGGRGARHPRRRLRAGRHPGRQDLEAPPGQGDQGQPRREPGDDPRLGRLPSRRRASASSTTPSTSSTAGATTAPTPSSACAPLPTPAPRTSPSATPTASSLPPQVAEATREVVAALDTAVGIHTHNDLECGVANSLAAVEQGASLVQGTINGIGERTGNANLTSILPALQLKLGYDVRRPGEQLARLTETAHFVDELLNVTPDPDQPYVGRNAFAHKGGMHVGRRQGRRQDLRAHGSRAGRQRARRRRQRALGQGHRHKPGRAGRAGARRRGGRPGAAGPEGARAPRLPVRGGARLVRAAAAARVRLVRAAVQARGLPRDHREARGRQASRPRPRSRSGWTASAT